MHSPIHRMFLLLLSCRLIVFPMCMWINQTNCFYSARSFVVLEFVLVWTRSCPPLLNVFRFTLCYQICRMIPGNTKLSIKYLGALIFFIILFLQMKIFLKHRSAFHHPEEASIFLFQGRWIQDEDLLKEPFSPESWGTCMLSHCSWWSPEKMWKMGWGFRIYDYKQRKHRPVSCDIWTWTAYSPSFSALSSCSRIEPFAWSQHSYICQP